MRYAKTLWALCAFAALSAVLPSCGGASARPPETVVRDFAAAIASGDYAAAYSMMSSAYRRRVAFADFERHLRDNPAEARSEVDALSHPDGDAEQIATVVLSDGEEIELRNDDGDWRISSNVVDFYDQSTPRAALRSFVRAMERERYDIVMRFVPNADREGMTADAMRAAWSGDGREDVTRLLTSLRASINNPIEEVSGRATMVYGEAHATVQFLREGGVWKIEDPD